MSRLGTACVGIACMAIAMWLLREAVYTGSIPLAILAFFVSVLAVELLLQASPGGRP